MRADDASSWWARGGVVVCLAMLTAGLLRAQAGPMPPSEIQIKAAFVYNFAKFVEWPDDGANSTTPIIVGVFGDDELARLVTETLRNKNVRGRFFEVRHFTDPNAFSASHVLFIASRDKGEIEQILHSTQQASTLTIGEAKNFCDLGGVIELFLDANKFRFDINAGAARQRGIRVSSRLLRLARVIKGN